MLDEGGLDKDFKEVVQSQLEENKELCEKYEEELKILLEFALMHITARKTAKETISVTTVFIIVFLGVLVSIILLISKPCIKILIHRTHQTVVLLRLISGHLHICAF